MMEKSFPEVTKIKEARRKLKEAERELKETPKRVKKHRRRMRHAEGLERDFDFRLTAEEMHLDEEELKSLVSRYEDLKVLVVECKREIGENQRDLNRRCLSLALCPFLVARGTVLKDPDGRVPRPFEVKLEINKEGFMEYHPFGDEFKILVNFSGFEGIERRIKIMRKKLEDPQPLAQKMFLQDFRIPILSTSGRIDEDFAPPEGKEGEHPLAFKHRLDQKYVETARELEHGVFFNEKVIDVWAFSQWLKENVSKYGKLLPKEEVEEAPRKEKESLLQRLRRKVAKYIA